MPDLRTDLLGKIRRSTGSLYFGVDPDDIGLEGDDFGGTRLGIVSRPVLDARWDHARVIGAEFGATVAVLDMQRDVELAFVLKTLDNNSVEKLFPSSFVGDSGDRVIEIPGNVPGARADSTRAGAVLYAADAPETPSILLYNAVPLASVDSSTRFSIVDELRWSMFFLALPATAYTPYRVARIGRLADLKAAA